MSRILSIIIILLFCFVLFSACSDKDKADMNKMLDDSISKSSTSVKSSSSTSSSATGSQASNSSSKGGSTSIDNKPPKHNQNDGITIHIPQSDLDDLSDAAKSASESIANIPEASYDSNRPDWEYDSQYNEKDFEYSYPEYSETDDWKEPFDGGTNTDGWYWQDDANIPDLEFEIPIPEFSGQGEGDTGYRGDTIPEFPAPPTDDIEFHFTIPPSPVK